MPRTRILVVDDASPVRLLLAEELGRDPGLAVVATAPSGPIALAKIEQLDPDLVVLDVHMDGMSGLETLAAIRERRPGLPVIMFSALTRRGANETIEALLLGASDYVAKPSGAVGREAALAQVRETLLPKIRAIARRTEERSPIPAPPVGASIRARAIDVVAIGVSTGGPNALAELVPVLPANFPVPVLVVQHMPPVFTRLLADALAAKSRVRVAEAFEGAPLEPGTVWIAPGDRHLEVARDQDGGARAAITTREHENSCRPSVDVLLRSVVAAYGGRVLAAVMTGMGQDGLRGCERVREAGGEVLAQDEATSVVWGMPGYVARAGLADAVLPLAELGPEIVRRAGRARPGASP